MLTKQQKADLIDRLNSPYGSVCLICDGRRITLRIERATKNALRYGVMTYIDGEFRGVWISGKEPLPEHKFLRKRVRRVISAAAKAKAEKTMGKRAVKADAAFFDRTITQYTPFWGTGRAAINHLCTVCDSVEIAPEKSEALMDAQATDVEG